MGTSLRTTYKQIILRVRVHTLHLRKQHMDGSKYKVVDAACVRSPEKPTCSGSLTHSVHSKGLNTSSCLSPNEPFACFPSEDEQINNKYNQHCVSSRLKGWQAEKICEGGKKKITRIVFQTLVSATARRRSDGVGHCDAVEDYIYTRPGLRGARTEI